MTLPNPRATLSFWPKSLLLRPKNNRLPTPTRAVATTPSKSATGFYSTLRISRNLQTALVVPRNCYPALEALTPSSSRCPLYRSALHFHPPGRFTPSSMSTVFNPTTFHLHHLDQGLEQDRHPNSSTAKKNMWSSPLRNTDDATTAWNI